MSAIAIWLRTQANRLIAVVVLLVALPHVIVAERVRPGAGHRAVRQWVHIGSRLMGLQFEQRGLLQSHAAGLRLLVPNHSSPLDIAAVLATHPTARFVAGADLFRIPLLASAMRALGTVAVDRKSGTGRLVIPDDEARAVLTVFPEGAIASRGHRLPFRRGAFALAIGAGAEIVPVAISHSAWCLPPKGALGVRPGTVVVEYLPVIATRELTMSDRHRLCDQVEKAVLAALDPSDGGTRSGPFHVTETGRSK